MYRSILLEWIVELFPADSLESLAATDATVSLLNIGNLIDLDPNSSRFLDLILGYRFTDHIGIQLQRAAGKRDIRQRCKRAYNHERLPLGFKTVD